MRCWDVIPWGNKVEGDIGNRITGTITRTKGLISILAFKGAFSDIDSRQSPATSHRAERHILLLIKTEAASSPSVPIKQRAFVVRRTRVVFDHGV